MEVETMPFFLFLDDSLHTMLSLSQEYDMLALRHKCQDYIEHQSRAEGMLLPPWREFETKTISRSLLFLYVIDEFELAFDKDLRGELVELANRVKSYIIGRAVKEGNFPMTPVHDVLQRRCYRYEENVSKICIENRIVLEKLHDQMKSLLDSNDKDIRPIVLNKFREMQECLKTAVQEAWGKYDLYTNEFRDY